MNLAYGINTAWMLTCRGSLRRFQRATRNVAATQTELLHGILAANDGCEFGRQHDFAGIGECDEFRQRVPLSDGTSVAPWIDRIAAGQANVLTSEPVRFLEPTSGSVSGRRLIPFTDSLRRQFQRGINPWIADLFAEVPNVRRGRAYWLVTPAIEQGRTEGGLKIGFDDDTGYLGFVGRYSAARVMAVSPSSMKNIAVADTIHRTLLQLLSSADLSFVSIWSPTFLLSLIEHLELEPERLIRDLRLGGCARDADRCQSILQSNDTIPEKLKSLWPRLAMVSCWADGASRPFFDRLRKLLPRIEFQAKGLISTEAFVSFPLVQRDASVLAIQSHFFEFRPNGQQDAATRLAHELSVGQRYEVIVTTGGGLYRYQTKDVVEVVGYEEQCPLIRFCGRSGKVSDIVGEKLTEEFVAAALQHLRVQHSFSPKFAMLVPQRESQLGYWLLVETDQLDRDHARRGEITTALEAVLSQNPYYQHAVAVGQLNRLQIKLCAAKPKGLWQMYEECCLRTGMRAGDIKPVSLETRFGWSHFTDVLSQGAPL